MKLPWKALVCLPALALAVGCADSARPAASVEKATPAPPVASSRVEAVPTDVPAPVVMPTRRPTASAPTPRATPSPATASPPSASAREVEVDIVDYGFLDQEVIVSPGQTVVWTNRGAVAHDAVGVARGWGSSMLLTGQEYRFTFRDPGKFEYICTIHPNMRGFVVVR